MAFSRLPHRLAAILYADVASYSRLTAEDEDDTHRALSASLDLITASVERYGGSVMHFAGDAVLAKFEAVVDALACAVQVQRELSARNSGLPSERKLEFRIGVNLGDVIEDRGDIYGDGVNVAARLEALAGPGEVCVSESVRAAVGKKLPALFEDLGEQRLKNIEQPVRAYRVVAAVSDAAQWEPAARRPSLQQSETSSRKAVGLGIALAGALALATVVAVVLLQPSSRDRARAPETGAPRADAGASLGERPALLPNSVAVLPFENLSPDPENAYFAAGIHETILHELSKINDLTVIARVAVLRYADGATPIAEIARVLRVEAVMEGSVQYADERVRITTELIDPATGAHLWSQIYERDFTDLFAIQTDIAERIAATLEAQLLASERESIAKPPTSSPEAQALFLKALATVNDLSPGTPPELSAEFQRYLDAAIVLDPSFARAYALKAVDYASYFVRARRISETDGPEDWERYVRENARRALELDPTLGIAHAALGRLHEVYMREAEARDAYERALALGPNDRDVLIDYSFFNTNAGRYAEAIALAQRAIDLDPVFGSVVLAAAYTRSGQLDAAAEVLRRLRSALPRWIVRSALVELARGRDAEALALIREVEGDPKNVATPEEVAWCAYAYGRLGRAADAKRWVARLDALEEQYRVSPETRAVAYLALRDRPRALEQLTVAAGDRTPNESWGNGVDALHLNSYRDPMLDEPELVAVRSRLGF